MQRYSRDMVIGTRMRHRIPCVGGNKGGYKEQDTAKIAIKAHGANGLAGGALPKSGRLPAKKWSRVRQKVVAKPIRWFAKGPVYLDQVGRAAEQNRHGPQVWLAVQARATSANGAPATPKWIIEATGLNDRAVRRAVATLVKIGMLKRDGEEISIPPYAKEP